MDRDVVMALFEPVVLFDIVQVVTSDDNRPAHFSRDDNAPIQNGIKFYSENVTIINSTLT